MQYVPFGKGGAPVSRLGFGCMRLPTVKSGDETVIDRPLAIAMIRRGIDGGITYVDTAYPYHGGESEIVVGLALKDGYREKVRLTSKLPIWLVNEEKDMNRLLDEQLRKLDVPYLDFYLLHAMDKERMAKMRSFHYKEFMRQAVSDGRIRHAGFSFHDDRETFLDILGDFDDWGMCQIQYNYLDDQDQATEAGLKEAGKRGVPVVVMEPLRGGALASPPADVAALIAGHPSRRSAVEWAFAYIADYPEVVTILSGMSTPEQVEDNLRIFGGLQANGLTGEERAFIAGLKDAYLRRMPVKCTGCAYCQPCPMGVKIPEIFEGYNARWMFDQPERLLRRYANLEDREGDAGRCARCGACQAACPQHLDIISWLDRIHREYQAMKK